MTVSPDALPAAARHVLGTYPTGISNEQAVVIGYSELTGQPLDPRLFDDAALNVESELLGERACCS